MRSCLIWAFPAGMAWFLQRQSQYVLGGIPVIIVTAGTQSG